MRSFLIRILKGVPDKWYLSLLYFKFFHSFPNLNKPVTFSEKIQWLKLYDRNPNYTLLVDKYRVKGHVAHIIGREHVIPLLGVWNSPKDIDFDTLPNQFVLKWNHDSGSVFICRDKNTLDKSKIVHKLKTSKCNNGYYYGREWPYKNVEPRIFAEQLIEDHNNKRLIVYKFFCFNGEPYIIQVVQNDKLPDETIDYYDCNWERICLKTNFPNSEKGVERPEQLLEMLDIARKLSTGIIHVRIDLFYISGSIFFSEFTFYSDSGFAPFTPSIWDDKLGEMIELPK